VLTGISIWAIPYALSVHQSAYLGAVESSSLAAAAGPPSVPGLEEDRSGPLPLWMDSVDPRLDSTADRGRFGYTRPRH